MKRLATSITAALSLPQALTGKVWMIGAMLVASTAILTESLTSARIAYFTSRNKTCSSRNSHRTTRSPTGMPA